jgi:hypothetical protein
MGQTYGGKSYNISDLSIIQNAGPTGWYNIKSGTQNLPVYIDQDYDGGGWICVMANRRYTAGMNNLKWDDAVYKVNYRHNGTDDATNDRGMKPVANMTLADVNIWVGLTFWEALAGRKESDWINVVLYTAGTNGIELNDTSNHTDRHRWKFRNWTGQFAFQGATNIATDVGATSGMYSFHAVNGYALTAYDRDLDVNSGNCATYYNNNPWWYGSCWSGNLFAGGGYVDGPHITGASNGTSDRQYAGVYIK